jgi:hypothetical protein
MTNKNIIQTLDNVGVALMDMEMKGKNCFKLAEILKALNAIRNEIESRDSEEQDKESEVEQT